MFTLHRFKSLASTNLEARKYQTNSVITADIQTKGKGRFRRKWSSKFGGIYISFVIKPKNENIGIQASNSLRSCGVATFMAALSVNKAIKKLYNLETEIKWPNDLLFNGKKLCGILTENIIKGDEKKMIIGIGLNVNNQLPKNLHAISLKKILKKHFDKEQLSSQLMAEFEYLYKKYYLKGKFDYIVRMWKSKCGTLGREVKIKTIQGRFIGIAVEVDKDCNLIIRLGNGTIKKIIEGDVEY